MTMGERIRELRLKKGLTQEELGRYIGVHRGAIMKYEKGHVENLKRSSIETLANLFGVSPSYLMCLDSAKKEKSNVEFLDTEIVEVPIIGRISAGLPLTAIELQEGTAFVPRSLIKNGFNYFYLRAVGDSMNLLFKDGDLVLVEQTQELENGQIGVVMVGTENATIKKYHKNGSVVMLEPMSTNPQNTAQIYNTEQIKVEIIGRAVSYQGII